MVMHISEHKSKDTHIHRPTCKYLSSYIIYSRVPIYARIRSIGGLAYSEIA